MPTFQVKMPGSDQVFEIDGPEGSTIEQAQQKVREQLIAQRPPESGFQDFAEGVGLSGLETYYGLKGLVTDLDDEEQARLEDWRQDAGQSGYGTAGRVTGEIGQLLVPGTAALKGAKYLPKAAKLGAKGQAALRALVDTGTAGVHGYVSAPDIGENRGTNAATDAGAAMLGEAGGYMLGKAIHGINKTPEAQRLLAEGVPLTPGQATPNTLIGGLETAAEVTPLVAHGVKRSRKAAEQGLHRVALQKAAPPGFEVTKTGAEGMQQLHQAFKDAYQEAWSGAATLSNKARVAFVDHASRAYDTLEAHNKAKLKRILVDFKELTTDITPQKFNNLDNSLRKAISAAKKDIDFQELLQDMRKVLREGAPADVATKLKAIDAQYGSYKVVERAAKNALENAGEFNGKQLVQAVKAVGKERGARGAAPLQQLAVDAGQTLNKQVGGQPLEWFRRIAGITPTPFPMQAGGRVVLGQTMAQKGAQKVADQVPELLRRPGVYGAAVDADEHDWWKYWE